MQAVVVRGCLVLILCLAAGVHASKRFKDVMEFGRQSGRGSLQSRMHGWSPDSNSWDEKLYPAWKSRDPRWENCWKGGKVMALLTSDSPALIGSNITFAVTLQFPRCQKENEDGDIVYKKGCGNSSHSDQDQYVYNWTKWVDSCGEGNYSSVCKFPDGRPFPHHHDWRRRNFIYVFHTQGQYYQTLGRSSAVISINTTNITAGAQMMEVTVFKKGYKKHYPVAKASGMYIVTDQIPFYVNISQKNDKNSSDGIFIKDSPVTFDVKIHDPSSYLKNSRVSFNWSFGDGSGSFVSNNPLSTHTYTLPGNFSVNLIIKAAIPGPCQPVTPTPLTTTSVPTTELPTTTRIPTTPLPTTTQVPTTTLPTTTRAPTTPLPTTTQVPTTTLPTTTVPPTTTNATENATELPPPETETFPLTTEASGSTEEPNITSMQTTMFTTSAPGCFIYRYGYYRANITVVDGILRVNIVEMTNIQISSQAGNSLVDFVVSCEGSLPTDACTTVSDASCMIPQNTVCDQIPASDQCLLTLRRTFPEPGSYCVNITLSDASSLALASTLVSVDGSGANTTTISTTLTVLGLVVLAAAVIGALLYKKYKGYKPIKSSVDEDGNRFTVYFSQVKDAFTRGNHEYDPLLKNRAAI